MISVGVRDIQIFQPNRSEVINAKKKHENLIDQNKEVKNGKSKYKILHGSWFRFKLHPKDKWQRLFENNRWHEIYIIFDTRKK